MAMERQRRETVLMTQLILSDAGRSHCFVCLELLSSEPVLHCSSPGSLSHPDALRTCCHSLYSHGPLLARLCDECPRDAPPPARPTHTPAPSAQPPAPSPRAPHRQVLLSVPAPAACLPGVVLQGIGPQVLDDDLGGQTGQVRTGPRPLSQAAGDSTSATGEAGRRSPTSAILSDPGHLWSDNQLKKVRLVVSCLRLGAPRS